MKCAILAGGVLENKEFYRQVLSEMEFLICADGGARHAQDLGVKPQLIVGDLDTLTSQEVEEFRKMGVPIDQYPSEKDYTDTHIALLKAIELGYQDITLLACLGGRCDHTIANIMLLALPEALQVKIRIVDEQQELFIVRNRAEVKGQKGEIISLFPLSNRVTGIKTEGLKYQVPHGTFHLGIPIGISNCFTQEKAVINVEEGLLLVIKNN